MSKKTEKAKVMEVRREGLRKDILDCLKSHPQGLCMSALWEGMSKRGHQINKKFYGVKKMADLFEIWKDSNIEIEITFGKGMTIHYRPNYEKLKNEQVQGTGQSAGHANLSSDDSSNTLEHSQSSIEIEEDTVIRAGTSSASASVLSSELRKTEPLPLIIDDSDDSDVGGKDVNVENLMPFPSSVNQSISWPKDLPVEMFRANIADILRSHPSGIRQKQLVEKYLEKHGYRIVANNFKLRKLKCLWGFLSDIVFKKRDSQRMFLNPSYIKSKDKGLVWGTPASQSSPADVNQSCTPKAIPHEDFISLSADDSVIDLTSDGPGIPQMENTAGGFHKLQRTHGASLLGTPHNSGGQFGQTPFQPHGSFGQAPFQPHGSFGQAPFQPHGGFTLRSQGLQNSNIPWDVRLNSFANECVVNYPPVVVKPISMIEFERKEISVVPVFYPRRGFPFKEDIERVCKECIDLLAEANEFVSSERIEKLLLQRYQVRNIDQLGVRHIDQIQCVYEHNRTICKVNAFVFAFIKTNAVCTLHEFAESLREFVPSRETFLALKLGPIQRFPVVYQQFKFPPDRAEIPEITSGDLIEHFRAYLTKTQKWYGNLVMEDFMKYLVEQYNAQNPYDLGVRIRSLPLLAQVLKKSQRDATQIRKSIYDKFKQEAVNDIEAAFQKFKIGILHCSSQGENDIREHYLKLKPEVAMVEVMKKYQLINTFDQPIDRKAKKQLKQRSQAVEQFIVTLNEDNLGKMLFHLAICLSDTVLEEAALEYISSQTGGGKEEEEEESPKDGDFTANVHKQKQTPKKEQILENLRKYLDRCFSHGTLNLSLLDRIEEKLTEDFDFPAFTDLKQGRFLQFLLAEAKQILDENGGTVLGSTSRQEGESSYRPQLTDLLEFIKQAKQAGLSQVHELEAAICSQFDVKDVHHLGHGNISHLQTAADKHGRHQTRDFTVFFEAAMTSNVGPTSQSSTQVGILGHQSRDAALVCLHNCPILEDLAEWSLWKLVFEPEHGKLKDFLQKYGGFRPMNIEGGRVSTLDLLALETSPGHLIKLTNQASPDIFAEALGHQDIQMTCGQLVSLAVLSNGTNNMPMALLANHVKTALLKMHAAEPQSAVPGGPASDTSIHVASRFVLKCLVTIPIRICLAVANKIFLEPLGQVVGSTKSKALLFDISQYTREKNRLQELGCLLGIAEWTHQLQQKCEFPASQIQLLPADMEELFVEESIEIESDADDVEELAAIILSDEDEDVEMNEEKEKIEKKNEKEIEQVEQKSEVDQNEKMEEDKIPEKLKAKDEKNADFVILDEVNKDVTGPKAEIPKDTKADSVSTIVLTVKLQEAHCKKIVEQIRRDEFGIGVILNEDGKRLMQVQQDRLGRSLDRLSKDLYSKDTHFVLELVQNADDNKYPENLLEEGDLCPSAKFIIDEQCIMVLNNECGFTEENVRALCDVGRSTKGKHKFGYIGQKGIGFKSVFRVTDCPEVHSSGYHIQFNLNSGPMGYILPDWVPDNKWRAEKGWMTKIVLPLKQDKMSNLRTLAARFNDIHPSLLLFLHRLREITIDNKIEQHVQTMRRHDLGNHMVEIKHSNGVDSWMVVRKVLDASKISAQAKSGVDVESTEIALAFPMQSVGQKTPAHVLPPKQPVFAFLPLRSYGFRFVIQGDFDVPSSREDVDKDSPWNQWLRSEIPTLFIEILEVFKSHPSFSAIEALSAFLQFVPMEDEILDFFKPVATEILKKLRGKPCVPTQPNSRGVISWKIPSQTVRVRDPLVHKVITPELLQKHLSLYYLHGDVASMLNPTLTQCLGIETLTTEHLIQLGKATIQDLNGVCEAEDSVHSIACLLACIYRSMDDFQQNDELIKLLREMKMIPLSDGKLVSLQEMTIFFPIAETSSNNVLRVLHKDLYSINASLETTPDAEINSQVHKMLSLLGVKQLMAEDVINHHILPVLKSEDWKGKSREILVVYVVFIKEQMERNPGICSFGELKDLLQLVTNHGLKNPGKDPIHFTHHYGSKINLKQTFPGHDWILLDDCYLPVNRNSLDIQHWYEFFLQLGVNSFLAVDKKEVHLDAAALTQSQWAPLKDKWPESSEYVIHDIICPELISLIQHNTVSKGPVYHKQMKDLCELLDREWDTNYSRYVIAQVCDPSGNRLHETETSISIALQTLSWLPAVDTKYSVEPNGAIVSSIDIQMMPPSCLYIRSSAVEKVLAQNVHYLEAVLSQKSSFSQFLGLKNSADAKTIQMALLEWSKRNNNDKPAVFCTTLQHMKNVYTYLYSELTRKQVQDLFRENPVVFVPDKNTGSSMMDGVIVAGKMLSRSEIWLEDKTGLFDKYHYLLEEFNSEVCKRRIVYQYYADRPEIIELFEREMNIDRQPQVNEYAELLTLITGALSLKDPKTLPDVLYIYSCIGKLVSVPSSDRMDAATADMVLKSNRKTVMKQLRKQKILATKQNTWVCPYDSPLIADNREWENMFKSNANVQFLQLDEKSTPQDRRHKSKKRGSVFDMEMIEAFLGIFGIKKLSDCVKIEDITELFEPCPMLQLYIHKVIPTVQHFLACRYPDVYQSHLESNMKGMLQDATFFQVGKLEVKYSLVNHPDVFTIRSEKCIIKPPTFFFHKDHLESISEVNRELARIFSNGNSNCCAVLRSFLSELSNILNNVSDDTIEELLQRHDAYFELYTIPDEELWKVQAPPMPASPEPDVIEPEENFEQLEQDQIANETVQNREQKFVSKAWPPMTGSAGSSANQKSSQQRGDKPPAISFPGPTGKDYMKSTKELPSQFKLAPNSGPQNRPEGVDNKSFNKNNSDVEGTGPNKAEKGLSTSTSTGPHSDRQKRRLSGKQEEVAAKRIISYQQGSNIGEPQQGGEQDIDGKEESAVNRGKGSEGPGKETVESCPGNQQVSKEHAGEKRPHSGEDNSAPPAKRPLVNMGLPIWTSMASDYSYDELGTSSTLPLSKITSVDVGSVGVGRWGEALVYNYLLQVKQSDPKISDIKWINADQETATPYDIEVHYVDQFGFHVNYIEVKSTQADSKEMFEISLPQLQFAKEKKERFHIYRVFNAGNPAAVRLIRISNLDLRLEQKQVRLCMFI